MSAEQPKPLVTDLDGTLIPLAEEPANAADLETLRRKLELHRGEIAFATGRHFDSVLRAIDEFQLPTPKWIVCDVGTAVYLSNDNGSFVLAESYRRELLRITEGRDVQSLRSELLRLNPELSLQEEPKQREFKLSFYVDPARMSAVVGTIHEQLARLAAPFEIISSLDPWQPRGLIDVIPRGASKASAVTWYAQETKIALEQVVYAGDSGNDLAALVAGCRAILVGNAAPELIAEVQQRHLEADWQERLYVADGKATSGVLEGCYWFGMFPQ